MNLFETSFIIFGCLFASALLGLFLSIKLPKHHLDQHSKDAIKIGAGLIATLTALVLGLLVSSAKSSYDSMNDEIRQSSAKIIVLDHMLAKFGEESQAARTMLKNNLIFAHEKVWPSRGEAVNLKAVEKAPGMEAVRDVIMDLKPQNDKQRTLQGEALSLANELTNSRWLLIQREEGVLPTPFLVVLVFWLCIFFMIFGLLSPPNWTIVAVMFICTISVAGAIFLIFEMNTPLQGMIKIPDVALRRALDFLNK